MIRTRAAAVYRDAILTQINTQPAIREDAVAEQCVAKSGSGGQPYAIALIARDQVASSVHGAADKITRAIDVNAIPAIPQQIGSGKTSTYEIPLDDVVPIGFEADGVV